MGVDLSYKRRCPGRTELGKVVPIVLDAARETRGRPACEDFEERGLATGWRAEEQRQVSLQ